MGDLCQPPLSFPRLLYCSVPTVLYEYNPCRTVKHEKITRRLFKLEITLPIHITRIKKILFFCLNLKKKSGLCKGHFSPICGTLLLCTYKTPHAVIQELQLALLLHTFCCRSHVRVPLHYFRKMDA